METRVTKLLGIEYPIIQGGMAWVANANLAANVSKAGGIGFNFGLLTSLVKLDMSVEKASGYRNGSFMASTNGMLLLEEVNMRNNRNRLHSWSVR